MKIKMYLIILTSVLCTASSQAAVYQWKDDAGKTHFSGVPPSNETKTQGAVERKTVKDSTAKSPTAQKDLFKETQALNSALKNGQKAAAPQETADAKERRLKECELSKESLRQYQAGGRISTVNEKGEHIYLDDAQIKERTADAKKRSDEICAEPSAPQPANQGKK